MKVDKFFNLSLWGLLSLLPHIGAQRLPTDDLKRDASIGDDPRRALANDHYEYYYDYEANDVAAYTEHDPYAHAYDNESDPSVPVLDLVRARDVVKFGTYEDIPGFCWRDEEKGTLEGFFVDFVRAIAAAVLSDPEKVHATIVSSADRFHRLRHEEFDILSTTTTWTSSRDREMDLDFCGVNYFDEQGFLVRSKLLGPAGNERDLESMLSDASGSLIGVAFGTTTEINLESYLSSLETDQDRKWFVTGHGELAVELDAERLHIITGDLSSLVALKSKRLKNPDEYVILNKTISREPLGLVVRAGDDQWTDLVTWASLAMIAAEEFGLTSANVDEMRAKCADDKSRCGTAVRYMLGLHGDVGFGFGVDKEWIYRIIKLVGNYGEVFDRHLTPLGLRRGQNVLAGNGSGGLLYAPPIQPLHGKFKR